MRYDGIGEKEMEQMFETLHKEFIVWSQMCGDLINHLIKYAIGW